MAVTTNTNILPPRMAVTTNMTTNAVTMASSRNIKLMEKLHLIDESAQRLQAMLREETASVPGQQIPDKALAHARKTLKAKRDANILDISTRDLSPKRKPSPLSWSERTGSPLSGGRMSGSAGFSAASGGVSGSGAEKQGQSSEQ